MMRTLVVKLLRDVRLALILMCVLLAAYQCLWAKITERIIGQLLPMLMDVVIPGISAQDIIGKVFEGPGKLLQSLLGGENIDITSSRDALTIGYVHPVTQAILCIWAVGRAAGAIAGEIDRGTMELLLAQPVPRYRLILAHLYVDLITIPLLCLSLWAGNWLGWLVVGVREKGPDSPLISPMIFLPALANAAALMFALSGFTLWLSSRGRFRGRVLGAAVFIVLVQFLVNLIGQLWEDVQCLRPFTVFFYYQPQQIILRGNWVASLHFTWSSSKGGPAGWTYSMNVIILLVTVGVTCYLLALRKFCTRDLPAPL
jgi:ABC-2 type transport system permease protein